MRLTLLLALAAAAAGRPAAAEEFEPIGEVIFRPRGTMAMTAAFDEDRVVGPIVNMTRVSETEWAGDLAGQNVHLRAVSEGRIRGSNVTLAFSQSGDAISMEGLWFGTRVRVSMDAKRLKGRAGNCSLDLKRTREGLYYGDVACIQPGQTLPDTAKTSLELVGAAAAKEPPQPQLLLAFFAVLLT